MKVIAWNIAHQSKKRPIPDDMVDVINALEADTVFFNGKGSGDYYCNFDPENRPFEGAVLESEDLTIQGG